MSNNFRLKRFEDFLNPAVYDTLKKTSEDDSKTPCVYLTKCKTSVINFDEVKKVYLKNRGLLEGDSMSVDALYKLPSDVLCMVEFKNGDFTSAEIIEKAMSSVLIFNDITNTNIKFTRENMVFVLVYNSAVKKVNHRQLVANRKANLSKKKYSFFGLEHLNGLCFKDVEEIDKSEFDSTKYVNSISVL